MIYFPTFLILSEILKIKLHTKISWLHRVFNKRKVKELSTVNSFIKVCICHNPRSLLYIYLNQISHKPDTGYNNFHMYPQYQTRNNLHFHSENKNLNNLTMSLIYSLSFSSHIHMPGITLTHI